MIISRRKSFDKSFEVLPQKIQNKVIDRLNLLIADHFADILNNHPLYGEWIGHRSINITGNYRLIFKELSNGNYELIELVLVGTHSQLY